MAHSLTVTIAGKPYQLYDIATLKAALHGHEGLLEHGVHWAEQFNNAVSKVSGRAHHLVPPRVAMPLRSCVASPQMTAYHLYLEAWLDVVKVVFQDCLQGVEFVLSRSDSSEPDAVASVLVTLLEAVFSQILPTSPPTTHEVLSEAVLFLCTVLRQSAARVRLSKFQCKAVLGAVIQSFNIPGASTASVFGCGSSRDSRANMALALSQFMQYCCGHSTQHVALLAITPYAPDRFRRCLAVFSAHAHLPFVRPVPLSPVA